MLFVFMLCLLEILQAQIYIGKETEISFFSKSTIEDIAAYNNSVKPVLNSATGDLLFKIPNTGFQFKSALMQEHFNETYMESDKFPFSTFEGKINEPIVCTKDGKYPITASGKLTIHGITKPINVPGTLTVKDNEIVLHSEFKVVMTDYDIEIPGIHVNTKMDSEDVQITIHSTLIPYIK